MAQRFGPQHSPVVSDNRLWLFDNGSDVASGSGPWGWYDPSHRDYTYWAWGQGRYRPLVDLTVA